MWNGENCRSGDGASIVIGPAVGSRRTDSSDVSVIFTNPPGMATGARTRERRPPRAHDGGVQGARPARRPPVVLAE